MSSKVLLFAALCLMWSCWGHETSSRSIEDIPMEPLDAPSDDLERGASLWRHGHGWQPWKIFQWGHHSIFKNPLTHFKFWESDHGGHHIHHDRRTLTRRDSSLIVTSRHLDNVDRLSTTYTHSSDKFLCESTSLLTVRPTGSVQKELVTFMFENMLDCIVESWETIAPPKTEYITGIWENGTSPSEHTFTNSKKQKKSAGAAKQSKGKRSRSKLELDPLQPADPLHRIWWSSPDERAIIHFKNGNLFEGNVSMKLMHGEGRFQWADGTVYLGQFKDNEIHGKGLIQWKDDTWYQGDFVGNLRHGCGLYVDSRHQKSYAGSWNCGAKHGQGLIRYSSFKNNYDGEWIHNVRHGLGSREYTSHSGYRGEWDKYVREGKGLMIWPNHDFYRGGWKNGVMSGYGIYIWDSHYNNTMSLPSIKAYRGMWDKGERNGYGILNLGLGLGSHYKGEFKNNKKHGVGKLVTNNGLILQNKELFTDDNIGPLTATSTSTVHDDSKRQQEPYQFDISDDTVGLSYHIEQAFENIDKQDEIRTNWINDYIENNRSFGTVVSAVVPKDNVSELNNDIFHLEDLIKFEKISLSKALKCYDTELRNIYYQYATICNTEEIHFSPVLIRLYLWQFYNDCNVHEKGLNLVEIDRMFHKNPEWLSQNPHNPFEKIYFWQFLQSLISVAVKLYAKNKLPGVQPDTILASAFRTFMEKDALPGAGRRKGRLVNGFGTYVPLKGAYELYRSLGEPHSVRKFLCAMRRPPHYLDPPQPALVEATDDATPIGQNAYVFGDEMTFIVDELLPQPDDDESHDDVDAQLRLKLFNFGNLSSKGIINIFSFIFPNMYSEDKIMDLDIEMTFYEFFEAFVACAEESIRIKDEEMLWRDKFSLGSEGSPRPPNPSPAVTGKSNK